MKRICKIVAGVFLVLFALLLLTVIGYCIAIPIINDITAENVAKDVKALPLPDGAAYCETFSKAGKLSGNGNGMQYVGGILIESGMSLEELRAFYGDDVKVRQQTGQDLTILEHVRYTLKTDVQGDDFYIVYAYGTGNHICQELDLRGH